VLSPATSHAVRIYLQTLAWSQQALPPGLGEFCKCGFGLLGTWRRRKPKSVLTIGRILQNELGYPQQKSEAALARRLIDDTPPQNGSCTAAAVPVCEPHENRAPPLSGFPYRNVDIEGTLKLDGMPGANPTTDSDVRVPALAGSGGYGGGVGGNPSNNQPPTAGGGPGGGAPGPITGGEAGGGGEEIGQETST